MRWLTAFFRGEQPLSTAFWGFWVGGFFILPLAAFAVLLLVGMLLMLVGVETKGIGISIADVLVILGVWPFVWSALAGWAVWRCAPNANWRGWSYLARGLVAMGAGLFLAVLVEALFTP